MYANGDNSGKKGGPLEPPRGRPKIGLMGSFDKVIHDRVSQYRPVQDGWGAKTIHVELLKSPDLEDYRKPSPSTIAAFLKDKEKTRSYKKQSTYPYKPCYPTEYAHDLWQMDAEGNKQANGLGTVCTLNVKDTFSKAYVMSLPIIFEKPQNHPKRIHYQQLLRLAFLEFGMNNRLQVDHESVYFDNYSASPFPTDLHLWLVGLGVKLHHTPKGQPQKQGIIERAHQTMHQQVIAGQTFDNYQQLFDRFQERRSRLNRDIPSRSTNNLPPLVNCPQAEKSQKPYVVDAEETLFSLERIKDFLRYGIWYRSVSKDKTITLGGRVYYLPKAIPKATVIVRFNPHQSTFIFKDADGKLVNSRPAQGLSFNELAGDIEQFKQFLKSVSLD